MHVLIADDERPARAELRYLLGELLPEATLEEAADGDEAVALARAERFDLAFLDIHMPGRDGLAVAAALLELPNPPCVVFATAYDAHAVEAFELAALDYVVKPYDERRLARTITRARQAIAERAVAAKAREALAAFVAAQGAGGVPGPSYVQSASPSSGPTSPSGRTPALTPRRLWAERENGNRVALDLADVLWLEAADKAVWAQLRPGAALDTSTGAPGATTAAAPTDLPLPLRVRHTLAELEAQLAEQDFQRVHKSYLVNLAHVAEMVPWFSGGWKLRLAGAPEAEIPVSRRYAARLRKREGWG